MVQGRKRERTGHEAHDAIFRQRATEAERKLVALPTARQDEPEPLRQPPDRKLERPRGRPVDPLHVVHCHQHRLFSCQRRQDGDERGRRRPRIGGAFRIDPEQRARERALLRRRQRRARLLERTSDEIPKGDVRELRLCLGRPRLENPVRTPFGSAHRLEPDGRLTDPRLALDHERCRACCHPGDEGFDRAELRLATDDRGHRGRPLRSCPGTGTSRQFLICATTVLETGSPAWSTLL